MGWQDAFAFAFALLVWAWGRGVYHSASGACAKRLAYLSTTLVVVDYGCGRCEQKVDESDSGQSFEGGGSADVGMGVGERSGCVCVCVGGGRVWEWKVGGWYTASSVVGLEVRGMVVGVVGDSGRPGA